MSVSSHCSDLCSISLADKDHNGYVPYNLGIGGGDDVEFDLCLNCGQLQGTWPLPLTNAELRQPPKIPEYSDFTKSVLDYVNATDGVKFKETFVLITTDSTYEQIEEAILVLFEQNHEGMVQQFLKWLDGWEHIERLENSLHALIDQISDSKNDEDQF